MFDLLVSVCLWIADPATQPDLHARLVAIDERASKTQSIRASFVQEKQSPLMADLIITRGTIAASGSNVLWKAIEPEPSQTHIGASRLEIFYPKQNVVEQYDLTPETSALSASPLPRLEALEATFEIVADAGEGLSVTKGQLPAANQVPLRLNPLKPELAKYVDHVRVLLDEERSVVIAFELTDPDGEVTLTRFGNIELNPKLEMKDVTLQMPADVKRVMPGGNGR